MNAQTRQDDYFVGLDFSKTVVENTPFGDVECFKAKNGRYYKLDIRAAYIAIESADYEEAKLGHWEDYDLFDVVKSFDDTAKLIIEELKIIAARQPD